MPNTLPAFLIVLLWLTVGFTGLFSLAGFLSHLDWKIELISHFRLQYAVLAAICLLGFLLDHLITGATLALIILLINLTVILPIYRHRKKQKNPGETYRLLFANILGTNTDYAQLIMAIRNAQADIVLLVEVRPNHLEKLLPALNDSHPFVFTQPDNDNFGLAIFSRMPFESAEADAFDETCTPALIARFQLDATPVTLLAIHPYPPKSRAQAVRRDHQLKLTAKYISTQTSELIIAGDLNCTSWSATFDRFQRESGLLDSRQGIGLQPSWPAGIPPLRIPIDHVFHTPGIAIHHRQLGRRTGSDHLPVIIEFSPIRIKAG